MRRSSVFARSSTRRRDAGSVRPARLAYRFSMDMAERNGVLFRRPLRAAERRSESAISRAPFFVKTPGSKSSALLSRVTRADQRFPLRGLARFLVLFARRVAVFMGAAPPAE